MIKSPRSAKIQLTKSKIWNKKFNLGRIANNLLDRLAEALKDGYILAREFGDVRGKFIAAWDELEEEMEYLRKKAEKRRLIYELRRRRLIAEEKTGDRVFYYLTEKGAAELARRNILGCRKMLPPGKICVVVFDIPESQRHVRETLRQFLKEAGFSFLQQSVWITQKDVLEALRHFIKSVQAHHWVNLFIADAIIMQPSKSKRLKIKFKEF